LVPRSGSPSSCTSIASTSTDSTPRSNP
jgi:hypothetical protein